MYFYKPRKKVFFCCGVVWPVTTNHLFLWQVREADSRFRRKKSKATSSLCFDTTHPRGGSYVWTRALCRPASKTGRGAHRAKMHKGAQRAKRENGWFHHSTIHSESLSQTLLSDLPWVLIWTVWFRFCSCFFFFFLSYFKKVTSKKILIGIDDFILLFNTFFVSFSHLTKKKSHPSTPPLPHPCTFLLLCKTQNGNTLL